MNPTTQSNTITIQRTRIHYLEAGAVGSPVIFFLHRASFSAQTWQDKVVLEKAGHACYLRATDEFHRYLPQLVASLVKC